MRAPAVAALAFLVSCGGGEATGPVDHASLHGIEAAKGGGSSIDAAGLDQVVKALSSRYKSKTQAHKAGYLEEDFCVAVPDLGGMGYHWANPDLVDPVFDPLQPEVVLYAPDGRGGTELVAVEYVVIDVGQPRPSFAGYPFDVGGAPIPADHWTLHVWVHKTNPSGLHAPFNPDVSCP